MSYEEKGDPEFPESIDTEGWVSVGDTHWTCADRVRNVLGANGIYCIIEGSVSYYILVAPEDVDRAKEILRQDVQKNPYYLVLYS
jgi:hypothetical protein